MRHRLTSISPTVPTIGFSPVILTGAAAFALASHAFGSRSNAGLAATGIILTVAIAAYIIDLQCNRHLYDCALGALCGCWYIASVSLRAVVVGFAPDEVSTPGLVTTSSLSAALVYSFLGLIALLWGYHYFRRERRITALGYRVWLALTIPPVYLHLAVIAGFAGVLIRSLGYHSAALERLPYVGSLPGLFAQLGVVSIGSLLCGRQRRTIIASLVPLGYAGAYTVGAALAGHRGMFFQLLMTVVTYILLYPNALQFRRSAIYLCLALLCGVLFIRFGLVLVSRYKAAKSFSYNMSLSERLGSAENTYKLLLQGEEAESGEAWKAFSRRIGVTLEHCAVVIERTPDVWPYQHGRTLLFLFTKFVPRALWPDKPDTSIDSAFYVEYLQQTRGGGASPSTSGDFYLNFGVPGIICGMVLIGAFFRVFQRFLIGASGDSRAVLAPMFFCLQTVDLSLLYASVSDLLGNALVCLLVVIAFAVLASRSRRVTLPVARSRSVMRGA